MHIQLTDFGSSFIDEDAKTNGEKKPLQRTNSFVGTAQFVAPEILQRGPVHYGFVIRINKSDLSGKKILFLDRIFGHLVVLFIKWLLANIYFVASK